MEAWSGYLDNMVTVLRGGALDPSQLGPVVAVILVVSSIALVISLITLFRVSGQRKIELPEEFGRMSNLGGRIEKLDRTVSTMRTEMLRTLELVRADIKNIKSGGTASGSEGSGSAGGGSTGSGSEGEQGGGSTPSDLAAAGEEEPEPYLVGSEADSANDSSVPERPETLSRRLTKTRTGLLGRIAGLFSRAPKIDAAMLDELEATLVSADLGVATVQQLLSDLKADLARGDEVNQTELQLRLKTKIIEILKSKNGTAAELDLSKKADGPTIVMVVGVNGVGKTTTTAKLASKLAKQGRKVLLVAADTFRAAAVEQLNSWGEKIGVPVVSGAADAKPQTVVFDAMKRALAENFDVVLIDTAGRLHTKSNLMQELSGVRGAIARHQPSAPHETLLVLDGITGQNALSQAQEFNQAVPLTGLVVTKLDGTPKGGIVVAITQAIGVPVRYIGVGESAEDLRVFEPQEFVEALFDEKETALVSPSAHAETRRRRRDDAVTPGVLH